MNRSTLRETAADPVQSSPSRMWGLSPVELHDAYWRSQGVVVVRWGEAGGEISRADGYLLLDPGQLAAFSLIPAVDELAWSRVPLHRVSIVSPREARYRERIVLGVDGLVKRVQRIYGTANSGGHRVYLATERKVAVAWSKAGSRRAGRKAVQSLVGAVRTGFLRVDGEAFRTGHAAEERAFIDLLVELWPDPSESLEGVDNLGEGVFVPTGLSLGNRAVIGPAWIGSDGLPSGSGPVVGPASLVDRDAGVRAVPIPMEEIWTTPVRRRRFRFGTWSGQAFVKRGVDIAVSATALLFLLPVMIAASLAIIVDDGFPVFFGHRRQGRDGRVFRCWKFRTMRRNAEALARELRDLNVCDGPQFFIKDDPRVTRVGRRLRSLNVDELPQLWNVLVGDMSLVGPRPSPEGENQYCPSWREARLSVRPGITGLWQVRRTRRPGYDFQEWIRYDIEYVRTASLWLDVKICVETLVSIIKGSGRHGSNGSR